MIYEMLMTGQDNTLTGRELAKLLKCDIRTVTEQIERERRQGQPICAIYRGVNAGYYIPQTREELKKYCAKLHKRAGEMEYTSDAMLKNADLLPTE